jgi:hypothetical protein
MTEQNDLFSAEIDFDAGAAQERPEPVGCPAPTAEPSAGPQGNGKGEPEQIELLRLPEDWEAHWKGMPEFEQKNLAPWKSIIVHFETRKDAESFAKLVGNPYVLTNRYMWYPEMEICRLADKRYIDELQTRDDVEIIDQENGQ